MTHDWRPISDVHEDSRASLTLFAESGKVGSRASRGLQYFYDQEYVVAAHGRIVARILRHPLLILSRAGEPRDHRYAICFDEDPTNVGFAACIREIVGDRFSVTPTFLAECLQIQNEELQSIEIAEYEIAVSDLISQQWLHPVRGKIDWSSSMIACRFGARNFQFRRCGYDVHGIEFDHEAAKDLGCRLNDTAAGKGHVSEKEARARLKPEDRWSDLEMTAAITAYCQRTGSADRDIAWKKEFKHRQGETGWNNDAFRVHWPIARGTEGSPGRQSAQRRKSA